jgi:hypothetical protein
MRVENEQIDVYSSEVEEFVKRGDKLVIEELKAEIKRLEDEVIKLMSEQSIYRQDGNFGLFFALNRKQNELASSLNAFVLDIQGEDKAFERYIKLTTTLKDTVEATNWLRINYLKMDEKEAGEAEKKGIPIIELMARKDKKEK